MPLTPYDTSAWPVIHWMAGFGPIGDAEDVPPYPPPPPPPSPAPPASPASPASSESAHIPTPTRNRSGLTPGLADLGLDDSLPLHQQRIARGCRRRLPPLRRWAPGPWARPSNQLGPGQPTREDALDLPRASDLNLQYGVPMTLGRNDGDVYRTVAIEGMPNNYGATRILSLIRGGAVYSFHLDPTPGRSWMTALIVFVTESGADAFIEYSRGSHFALTSGGAQAMKLANPTYPMPLPLLECPMTRCLVIRNGLHRTVQSRLANWPNAGNLIAAEAHTGVSGERVLQFFSVRAANWVFRRLSECEEFNSTTLDFAPDPAAAAM
ncbi:hypothetical protein N7494_006876 [Penicillium frequentans]|uniref:Uncharacterized protein n=1 Tax=Penicillium frequentans TaxID=3151616 RepID=A0AAD6GH36_9EURO|nr:hypothetical protein N7494_006876 [Penicillium glabrum]